MFMMTKREQFELTFYKVPSNFDGRIINVCKKEGAVNSNNSLQLIGQLDKHETESFIDELNKALSGRYYEEYFTSDSVEHESIELKYPNVIIGENDITISMEDMKGLLQEWCDFID
jgi:hypothetical protein